jgi:hypothetical protein
VCRLTGGEKAKCRVLDFAGLRGEDKKEEKESCVELDLHAAIQKPNDFPKILAPVPRRDEKLIRFNSVIFF